MLSVGVFSRLARFWGEGEVDAEAGEGRLRGDSGGAMVMAVAFETFGRAALETSRRGRRAVAAVGP